MSLQPFIAELRRRHVFRVAAWYGAVAWLVIQIAVSVFPALDLPAWSHKLIVILILLGFPFALLLAWAFELTPDGVKRAAPLAPDADAAAHSGWGLSVWLGIGAGVLLTFGAMTAWQRLSPSLTAGADKSIAVLPFENLSADANDAFFVDGLQDELITKLARIRELKVTSRTSVMEYKGHAQNLREVGAALGVATILEGSVRKSGNRVRLSVQLIDTASDTHLWAETYERELTDVFQIQAAVAEEIAQALRANFSPDERASVGQQASSNPEAYDLYLRARRYGTYFAVSNADRLAARDLYQRALALDPGFTAARGQLAVVDAMLYQGVPAEHTPARLAEVEAHIAGALASEPELPAAHYARAYLDYYEFYRFEDAMRGVERVLTAEPSNAEALVMRAWLLRRFGRFEEMASAFRQAVARNPRQADVLSSAAQAAQFMKRYAEAAALYDQAIALEPDRPARLLDRAYHEVYWHGDLSMLRTAIEKARGRVPQNQLVFAERNLAEYEGRFDDAIRAIERIDWGETGAAMGIAYPRTLALAIQHLFAGDRAGAKRLAKDARQELEQALAGRTPDVDVADYFLGAAFAAGDKAETLRWLAEEERLGGALKDAVRLGETRLRKILVLAWFGETDQALGLLEREFAGPGSLYPNEAALGPAYAPLHGDPRFQALVAKYRPQD